MSIALRIVAGALAALLLATLLPPVRAAGKALTVGADAIGLPLPRPLAAPITRTRTEAAGVTIDVYAPTRGGGPPVLLVPGATPAGLDDSRVVAVAEAVARAHRTVVLPELELYDEELTRDDVERIVATALATIDAWHRDDLVVVGISYGGSLATVAAADPDVRGAVTTVGLFGAYADLVGVLQAITTGRSLVGGEELPWDGHPDAQEVLHERVVELLPDDEQAALREALAGEREPDTLPAGAAALYALLTNTDPARTYELAAQLPAGIRERIAGLSPVSVLDELDADLLVLHATDDPLVPFAEALRFVEHREDARLYPLDTFGHVGAEADSPRGWLRAAGDLGRVWRFSTRLLAPQEGVVPQTLRRSRAADGL